MHTKFILKRVSDSEEKAYEKLFALKEQEGFATTFFLALDAGIHLFVDFTNLPAKLHFHAFTYETEIGDDININRIRVSIQTPQWAFDEDKSWPYLTMTERTLGDDESQYPGKQAEPLVVSSMFIDYINTFEECRVSDPAVLVGGVLEYMTENARVIECGVTGDNKFKSLYRYEEGDKTKIMHLIFDFQPLIEHCKWIDSEIAKDKAEADSAHHSSDSP